MISFRSVLMLLLAILLVGCTVGVGTPTVVPTPIPTRTKAPTATHAPTATVEPSATPSPTPMPTFTASPTATSELFQARLFTIGFLPKWKFFFALELPDKIQGEYYALVDKNKEYTCEVRKDKPQRLYCLGPQAAIDDWVDYVIYERDTHRPVFEGRIYVPLNIP